MAFTYDPTLFYPKDQVRFLIQDTTASRPLFQDEEIDWMLATEANVYTAGAMLCDTLVARAGNVKMKKVGELIIQYDVSAYRMIGFNLRSRGLTHQIPYAGGISIADKTAQTNDPDWVSPAIARGVGENPLAPQSKPKPANPLETI